jgi:hypothetical protein
LGSPSMRLVNGVAAGVLAKKLLRLREGDHVEFSGPIPSLPVLGSSRVPLLLAVAKRRRGGFLGGVSVFAFIRGPILVVGTSVGRIFRHWRSRALAIALFHALHRDRT